MPAPTNATRYVGLDFLGGVTVASTAAAIDKILDCDMSYQGNSMKHISGINGQDSTLFGMYGPEWKCTTQLQTATLLACAQRGLVNQLPGTLSGTPAVSTPITSISFGIPGVDARQQQVCFINEVTISCSQEEEVKVDYSGLALGESVETFGTPPTPNAPNLGFTWIGSSVLLGSTAYGCKSFKATLKNGLKHDTSLDLKTAGVMRAADSIIKGVLEISLEVEFKMPPPVSVIADWPSTFAFVFVAKNTKATPQTFTLTLGDLIPKTRPLKGKPGAELITWPLTFETPYNDLTAWTAAIA